MIYPDTDQTAEEVANHYNNLDKYYRQIWGEHVHHGVFKTGAETVLQATENLIELVAKAGDIKASSRVLDIGCGYGATARYLSRNKRAFLTALTISKSQWQYARLCDPESSNPRYLLGDFFHNDYKSQSYDTVIAIESSEHMIDKPKFFKEIHRLLKPGGRLITCAWLSKTDPTSWEVKHLLEPICREGHLPSMGSEEDYVQMIQGAGLGLLNFEDLSRFVKKTWSICAIRASCAFFSDRNLRKYILSKKSTERFFAKSLFRIWAAYQKKAMRYGIFTAEKKDL